MAHKKLTISLSEKAEKALRELSVKTGLKLSTIIEKGIKLFEEASK